ncbi:amidohydrolase family protein [Labedaea rhizosphaerae]|uniref:L-fuconolactonase n=1 Tax=Labedaea rhizosphaerae TaxID=598644 RepID=A0A4R6S5Y8_LABRH|nr:amidohydrolase family protein [Labedaea rhizosphaerae]TDP95081.1 L-fuconolactonase [Labedaea rhizosphaerae]
MSRVDAHHHVWDLGRRPHTWLDGQEMAPIRRSFSLDDLAPLAAAAGIEATVLVQVLPEVGETREFLALAGSSPLVAGVVGWVDLTDPGVADVLAQLRSGPGGDALVGIRHLVQGEADGWLDRPDVRRGLAAVADAGLVYDLLTLPPQLPAAIEVVRALPQLTFVLDHLSKPPIASGPRGPWASDLRALAALPNVSAKLSGLVTEATPDWTVEDLRPYVEVAIEAFGPDRLMTGSDWPVCLLAAPYADVLAAADVVIADLSPAERDQVRGGTAQRVYGLEW